MSEYMMGRLIHIGMFEILHEMFVNLKSTQSMLHTCIQGILVQHFRTTIKVHAFTCRVTQDAHMSIKLLNTRAYFSMTVSRDDAT
jgi:hypothetical protein